MSADNPRERVRVLDPVERVTEIVFGVLMALTFTGTLSVATAGREQVRTMMFAALGCNLAWGLADGAMYLIRTFAANRRQLALLVQLRATVENDRAHQMIVDVLPPLLGAHVEPASLESLRKRLLIVPLPETRLISSDYIGALCVFFLVVLATFPVVVPFIFVTQTAPALRISNLLAVCTLFFCGHALGRHTFGRPWAYGLAMTAVGAALVAIIIALGG
jgi:VIT1/CCC1 family predicted Fe2+/Mn2+ transporter